MYNISGKLKQFTLGATLSLALAFLIVHPGMFANVHAYPTPPDYQFEEPDRIAPDLEGEDYDLNPFYAGRPLNEDLIYPNILGWIATAALFFAGIFWDEIEKAWNGFTNVVHRSRFWKWIAETGYGINLGKTYCGDKYDDEDNPEYKKCRTEKLGELIREYVKQANNCEKEKAPSWKEAIRGVLRYDVFLGPPSSEWSCVVTTTKRTFVGRHPETYVPMYLVSEFLDHRWKWDASPWLGQ